MSTQRVAEGSVRDGREKGLQAIVGDAFDNYRVGDLMQASVKLSDALCIEMQTLCYERHKNLPLVATTEEMPYWMEGNDYIAGRESGLFAVLNCRLERATELIKLAPAYVPGYLQRASVLCVLNRWAEARETYVVGLSKCKDTALIREALSSLSDVQEAVFRAEVLARDELRGQRKRKSSPSSLPPSMSLPPRRLSSSTSYDSTTSKYSPRSSRSSTPIRPASRSQSLPVSMRPPSNATSSSSRQQCPHLSALARRLT